MNIIMWKNLSTEHYKKLSTKCISWNICNDLTKAITRQWKLQFAKTRHHLAPSYARSTKMFWVVVIILFYCTYLSTHYKHLFMSDWNSSYLRILSHLMAIFCGYIAIIFLKKSVYYWNHHFMLSWMVFIPTT